MRIFRVGGAVRDLLLGRTPKDHDFVVVGATVPEFLAEFPGAQRVGQAFPVFLVKEKGWEGEFAFARRERKTGAGHQGFDWIASPDVTLEEDLSRRDLTCNAIALPVVYKNNKPLEGQVIDPFGGVADIKAGILRHVGPAFSEDPLRVFRLARFSAQLGWEVALETLDVAASVPDEEILALSAERVGEEFRKAMRVPAARNFLAVLDFVGKLWLWFPELDHLRNVPAGPAQHHAEGDALTHTKLALDALPPDVGEAERIATVFHDLGKGITPEARWPSHAGHDVEGVPLVEAACERLRLSGPLTKAAVMACREHMRAHVFLDMRKGKMVDLIRAADATVLKAEGLATVCCADACGRIPAGGTEGPQALRVAAAAARAERGLPIPDALTGEAIGLHVRSRKGSAARKALHAAGFLPKRPALMLTLTEAAELHRLIEERARAQQALSDYRTWRHPDEDVTIKQQKAYHKADAALREYVDRLTVKPAQAQERA